MLGKIPEDCNNVELDDHDRAILEKLFTFVKIDLPRIENILFANTKPKIRRIVSAREFFEVAKTSQTQTAPLPDSTHLLNFNRYLDANLADIDYLERKLDDDDCCIYTETDYLDLNEAKKRILAAKEQLELINISEIMKSL